MVSIAIFISFQLPVRFSFLIGDKCGRSCQYGHGCPEHGQELAEEVEEMHDDLHHTLTGHCPHHRALNFETVEEITKHTRLGSIPRFARLPEAPILFSPQCSRGFLERFER